MIIKVKEKPQIIGMVLRGLISLTNCPTFLLAYVGTGHTVFKKHTSLNCFLINLTYWHISTSV